MSQGRGRTGRWTVRARSAAPGPDAPAAPGPDAPAARWCVVVSRGFVVLALAGLLAGCDLLTDPLGRSFGACGVYPAVPLDSHRSARRAADYYDEVLLPEATSRDDRRELRREARHSPYFVFFRQNESVTLRGRSREHRYLVRVEDGFDEYWTHENELSGLEAFCPYDEP